MSRHFAPGILSHYQVKYSHKLLLKGRLQVAWILNTKGRNWRYFSELIPDLWQEGLQVRVFLDWEGRENLWANFADLLIPARVKVKGTNEEEIASSLVVVSPVAIIVIVVV